MKLDQIDFDLHPRFIAIWNSISVHSQQTPVKTSVSALPGNRSTFLQTSLVLGSAHRAQRAVLDDVSAAG